MKDVKSTENKKQAYLKEVNKDFHLTLPKPIKAMDLDELFSYYKEKHRITLIKNGDFSPEVIKENERNLETQLEKFTNQELNYAFLLKEALFLKKGHYSIWPILIEEEFYPELYKEIQEYIAPYLSEPISLKQDLSDEEMAAVQDLCKNKFSRRALLQLDKCLQYCVDYFEEKLDDVCLTKQQVLEEIKKIQANLGEQQAVGYVFTNNRKRSAGHFESIIITRDVIYKPIEWPGVESDNKLSANDFSGDSFYSADLKHFWKKPYALRIMPMQQTDAYHSSVLGIAGVKRLLQNDAMELTRNSLAFSFYTDDKGSKQHLFIPSPIFLQYSQSPKYMYFLSEIVGSNTSNDPLKERQETSRSPIPTLEQVLLQSTEYANLIGDKIMMEQNKETLAVLPAFREQWQQGYELACRKHHVFDNKGPYDRNFFLNFLANRMEAIIATRSAQGANTNSFFAPPISNNSPLTKDNGNYALEIKNN